MLVDAHFHLWDPALPAARMAERASGAEPPLRPRRLRSGGARPRGVRAGVLVQALASASETEDLLAIAAASRVVAGVVGWVDLERADVAEQIERLRALPGGESLVGIRHLVAGRARPALASARGRRREGSTRSPAQALSTTS